MLHWEPLHKYGLMCAIRGQTYLWECTNGFCSLETRSESHILFFLRCIYNAFFFLFSVLNGSIAFFVFLSRPFPQLAHKAQAALLAESRSVTPPSLPVLSTG